MKLLFDQNLSYRLVVALSNTFPDSTHVRRVGLATADDFAVWNYAKHNSFTIISKDADFHQRSLVFGHPPKVIWLRLGNCSTAEIEKLIRHHVTTIHAFENDTQVSFISLSW